MDSGSHAAVDGGGGRSGGKILKRRKIAARKTPYDRPTLPLQPESHNWVNALVSPARFVAVGASKLISSIWNPKSWGSKSSSSESDSGSEGGIEDDYECDENLQDDDADLNQNKGRLTRKREIIYLVEQLLMLEHFSREECDRLIKIINLRFEDHIRREGVDAGSTRKMITENPGGSVLKSHVDNSIHGSKSVVTPNMDYLSGGSWNIRNEMQQLHSKAIELMKPNKPFSLEAPNSGNESVNVENSKDTRATLEDVPTETLSSRPTIKEKYQIIEEKDFKDDKKGDDMNPVEGNSDLITEYAEVADFINTSQGSSNTNDPNSTYDSSTVKRAVTRTRKYNTRRGMARGK